MVGKIRAKVNSVEDQKTRSNHKQKKLNGSADTEGRCFAPCRDSEGIRGGCHENDLKALQISAATTLQIHLQSCESGSGTG